MVDIFRSVLVVSIIIMCLGALYYIRRLKEKISINQIVDKAAEESAFSPTMFKIYDRSTKDICDRLIIVSPFDWHIWACRGELYILNPEGGLKCHNGSTSAIRILKDDFIETCLNVHFDAILNSYMEFEPKYVPYEITTKKFTILSSINILVQEWITFNLQEKTNILSNNIELHEISSKPIYAANLIQATTKTKNHSELLRSYRKHHRS